MTIQQAQSIQNLYQSSGDFVRSCLLAKLAFDEPDALAKEFDGALRIIENRGLEITEAVLKANFDSVTQIVERRYPELGKEILQSTADIVAKLVFKDDPATTK